MCQVFLFTFTKRYITNCYSMKKLLLLLLFGFGISNAQIVNIPDSNLKNYLLNADNTNGIAGGGGAIGEAGFQWIDIDTNNDNEIQVTEAEAVTFIKVPSYIGSPYAIADLSGLEAFINLTYLDFSSNNVSLINLQPFPLLEYLICYDNQLAEIDLSMVPNLKLLHCASNNITNLDFTGLLALENVNCSSNQLTTLDFHNNPVFYDLGCAMNNLTSINIKNGTIQNTMVGIMHCDGWFNNPDLSIICADDNEIADVQAMLDFSSPDLDVDITNCLLDIDKIKVDESIQIFPNPTKDFVNIKAAGNINSIQLFDVQGRIIKTSVIQNSETRFDLSQFQSGIYYLKVISDKGNGIQKLIKN